MKKAEKSDRPASPPAERFPYPFRSMRQEMNDMVSAFSMPQMSWSGGSPEGALALRVDVAETENENEIEVTAELPGIPEKDVEITLEGDGLRICAEKSEAEKGEKNWRVVERSFGAFKREIRVPAGVDPEKVNARLENGVLTVTLPKPSSAKPSARKLNEKAGR